MEKDNSLNNLEWMDKKMNNKIRINNSKSYKLFRKLLDKHGDDILFESLNKL